MQIKITRKNEVHIGKTKAFLSIELTDLGIAINGVKAIENAKGELFFSLPQQSYQNKQGETKYSNHVSFIETDVYWSFQNSLKDAYESYEAGTQQSVPLSAEQGVVETGSDTAACSITDDNLPF